MRKTIHFFAAFLSVLFGIFTAYKFWTVADPQKSTLIRIPEFISTNIANLKNGGMEPLTAFYNLYESIEVWRAPDSFGHTYKENRFLKEKSALKFQNINGRPRFPPPSSFASTAHYLQTPLIADYPPNAEKVFLMIKTGASVLWQRLPVHLFTTLTRVPNFAIYSDAPGSIGGHEVIDVLANLSSKTKETREFRMYQNQHILHDSHANVPYTDVDRDGDDHNQGWRLDRFKNIPMLAHAWTVSPESDWFIFMDADTYFFIDTLLDFLSTLDPNEPHYIGSDDSRGCQHFAYGGGGVVLSRRTLKDTMGIDPKRVVKDYEDPTFKKCCGDLMVGIMIREITGTVLSVHPGFQREPPYLIDLDESRWCKPLISFHHVNPHDIEVLSEYERVKRLEGTPILHADFYRDFVLPFIGHRIENWDNEAMDIVSLNHDKKNGIKPSTKGGPETRPYESVDECERYCKSLPDCLSYRFVQKKNECRTGNYIRLGKPALGFQKSTRKHKNQGIISGWNIERIQEIRRRSGCDELPTSDGNDRSEGWMRRIGSVTKPTYG